MRCEFTVVCRNMRVSNFRGDRHAVLECTDQVIAPFCSQFICRKAARFPSPCKNTNRDLLLDLVLVGQEELRLRKMDRRDSKRVLMLNTLADRLIILSRSL